MISRRPRQESTVVIEEQEAVNSEGRSGKRLRGAAHPPLAAVTVKEEQGAREADAPSPAAIEAAEATSAAAAAVVPLHTSTQTAPPAADVPFSSGAAATATPPPSRNPAPPPALVPLSSVLALEALLRRAVTLVVPLLSPPPPRRLVDSWLDRWESRLRELEEHLDMDVLAEGCRFQRRLAAAVAGGEAGNCESMLRMIQLLP